MSNFFPINEDDWEAIQFNFDRLSSLLIDTGGVATKQRGGTAVVTWPGGAPAATVLTNIAHGMGSTPARIVCSCDGAGPWAVAQPKNIGATTFDIAARTFDGTNPVLGTTASVYWEARG